MLFLRRNTAEYEVKDRAFLCQASSMSATSPRALSPRGTRKKPTERLEIGLSGPEEQRAPQEPSSEQAEQRSPASAAASQKCAGDRNGRSEGKCSTGLVEGLPPDPQGLPFGVAGR